jgi:hypothetical protein
MAKDVPSTHEIMRRVQRILEKVDAEAYVPKLFSAKDLPNAVSVLDFFLSLVLCRIMF